MTIIENAIHMMLIMPTDIPEPDIWFDEAEIGFEWIIGDKHAVLSIEEDSIGYTMLLNGQFVPGKYEIVKITFPDDLTNYLRGENAC